jgi:hypothetical protein
MRSPFDSSPEILSGREALCGACLCLNGSFCGSAAPNPRGIPRDARSPARGVPGPVPVRSRFRDTWDAVSAALLDAKLLSQPQRRVRWQQYRRSAGPDSGIGVADEDFTFVEAALQVVETFASRFTRRAVLFTSVIRKRSTFWPGRRTAYERQTAARPHHCSPP